jgi:hypothetical protein
MTILHKNTTKPSARCITINIKRLCDVQLCQHMRCSQQLLQSLKCFITLCIPDIVLILLQKISDVFSNIGEVQNESSVINSQSTDLMQNPWWFPIEHIAHLARIHGYSL